jgi:hypothetical protein
MREGRLDGETFELSFAGGLGRGRDVTTDFKGRVDGAGLSGTVATGSSRRRLEGQFTATRSSGAPGPVGGGSAVRRGRKPTDGSPAKPAIDDNLEPLKALLEKRIPAVITSRRAPAILDVVAWFGKNQLPYLLQDADDAVDTPQILGEQAPGLLFTPSILERQGSSVENAAASMSEQGLPVGLVSGDTAGARYLPLHAALAVRYGMDPTEALKAISLYPARMFKIDDRVGSLKRGKHADFVVFSGNPLEMTSRVQLVVINGAIVVDNRNTNRSRGE